MLYHGSIVLGLLSSTLALPNVSVRRGLEQLLHAREVCYDDDVLLSFKEYRRDAVPYCSSLLNIHDTTTTVAGTTSYTTTSIVETTEYDNSNTVTVPQATVTSTTTTTVGHIQRRNGGLDARQMNSQTMTSANPVASMASGAEVNASIASAVYSACSCLRIKPSTVTASSVAISTRTVVGIDYEDAPTATEGTTTVIVTQITLPSPQPPIFGSSVSNSIVTPPVSFTFPPLSANSSVSIPSPPSLSGEGASKPSIEVSSSVTTSVIGVPTSLFPTLTLSSISGGGLLPSASNGSIPSFTGVTNPASKLIPSLSVSTPTASNVTVPIITVTVKPVPVPSASLFPSLSLSNVTASGISYSIPFNGTAPAITGNTRTGSELLPSSIPFPSLSLSNISISGISYSVPFNGTAPAITGNTRTGFEPLPSASLYPSLSLSNASISGVSYSKPHNGSFPTITGASRPVVVPLPSASVSVPVLAPNDTSYSNVVISTVFDYVSTSTESNSSASFLSTGTSESVFPGITNPAKEPTSLYPQPSSAASNSSFPALTAPTAYSTPSSLVTRVSTSTNSIPVRPPFNTLSNDGRSGYEDASSTPSASISTISSTLASMASPSSSDLSLDNSINPLGCPSINNTAYSLNSTRAPPSRAPDKYQLQCYRQFTGPSDLGIEYAPSFKACMQECTNVNLGFSSLECFGVTWLKYKNGIKCYLKTQMSMEEYREDHLAISAVLLTNVPPPIVGLFHS